MCEGEPIVKAAYGKASPVNSMEKLDAYMETMQESQDLYRHFSQEQVDAIFKKVAMICTQERVPCAQLAVDETGRGAEQWLCFSRNIGQVSPKITYFRCLIKPFLDQSIREKF